MFIFWKVLELSDLSLDESLVTNVFLWLRAELVILTLRLSFSMAAASRLAASFLYKLFSRFSSSLRV